MTSQYFSHHIFLMEVLYNLSVVTNGEGDDGRITFGVVKNG